MSQTPLLERIGLNEKEQKIYLALLALGPLSAGEIAKYTGISPISEVKTILGKLYTKNYAYNIEGLVDKTIGLYPFKEMAEEAGKDSKKIDDLVAELKLYVSEQVKHFDQVMKEAEDFVNAEKAKSTKKITDNSTQMRTAIDTKTTESTTAIKNNVEATKKKIKADTDEFLKHQTETTDAFETSTINNLDTFATNVKTKSDATMKQMGSTIKGKNDQFLTDGQGTIEVANNNIIAQADNLAGQLKVDSKENLEATRDHVVTGLETFTNETSTNIKEFDEKISSAVSDQETFITETTNEAKKNRIDRNHLFKEGLAANFDGVREDIEKDFGEFEQNFNSKLAKIADKFKKQIDDLTVSTAEDIKATIDMANATVADLIKKHNEEIATNVDLDNKAIEDGTVAMLSKIEEYNATATKAINSSVDTLNSSTMLLKANYSADINSKIEGTITGMHAIIDETTETTKGEYTTTKNTLVEKLTTTTNANSNNAITTATNTASEIATMTTTSVTGAKDKLKEAKGAFLGETKKAKENVANHSVTSVDNVGKITDETIQETSKNAKTNIRTSEETTIATINTVTKVVEDTVRKEITATKGSLDDFYKRFAKDALKISTILQQFRTQHESLQKAVIDHPKPRVETAILYSKAAIFDRLDEMLTDRVKSNVVMVIPDPTDIPTKLLAKVKPQAKMTIISKIDEVANKGVIDQINASDSLGRTKIRKISMQDMIGYSEYLAFDRDGGEEMMIAFKDETEKDWVGILSTSDGFKNVVIGETLGRQALSISRELK